MEHIYLLEMNFYFFVKQTNLLTGQGNCTSYPITKPSTSTMFYCSRAYYFSPDNCNSWENMAWQCNNPAVGTYVNCTSNQWLCVVRNITFKLY